MLPFLLRRLHPHPAPEPNRHTRRGLAVEHRQLARSVGMAREDVRAIERHMRRSD